MFRNSISIAIFSFGLAYFKKNLIYKTEKNHNFSHLSEIFQLIVFTTVHCRNKFFTMIFNLLIYYMFWRLQCFLFLSLTLSLCNCSFWFTHFWVNFNVFLFAKIFKSYPICSFINPKFLQECFFRETIFWKLVNCLWHSLFSLFELWQVSKKYL